MANFDLSDFANVLNAIALVTPAAERVVPIFMNALNGNQPTADDLKQLRDIAVELNARAEALEQPTGGGETGAGSPQV